MTPACHRLLAFFTGLCMFCLVVVEAGVLCAPMAGMAAEEDFGVVAAEMPGMAGTSAPSSGDRCASTTPPLPDTDDDDHEDESPCSFPWARSGCHGIAPCSPSTLHVASTLGGRFLPRAGAHVVAQDDALRSFTAAPEPPPPRA